MVTTTFPRLTISGLRGGSGKTVLTLGLIRAWRNRGLRVIPFKKGPDYIDPAWLSLASGEKCRCVDTFLMGSEGAQAVLRAGSVPSAISLIEGNRGLFDGVDTAGTHSTAELAKLMKSPVVLVVDCTKATRTVAAMVLGCTTLDQNVNLAGVILNQVGSARQERLVRQAVEEYAGASVLGAMPRVRALRLRERHLGLVPPSEHPHGEQILAATQRVVEEHVDVERVLEVAGTAEALEGVADGTETPIVVGDERPRIGVVRDSAFNFYYPENLEQLERLGAQLVFINALEDAHLPSVDALYIGGGFPETHAARLADNQSFRQSVRAQVEHGLPVYAECGGLTFLGDGIVMDGITYPMVGVFPVQFEIAAKPVGHGYAVMEVDQPNPFFAVGTTIRGHEFRYSRALGYKPGTIKTAARVARGKGFDGERGGLCYKNVFASFCHVHALGLHCWARTLVDCATQYRRSRRSSGTIAEECPAGRL
jgi:cobyrinic acid a,c-diamide synthase